MTKIILATTSPYRIEAFKFLDIDFASEGSQVDEKFDGRPDDPCELVLELSKRKAESVAENHTDGIVIGFDSVGWFDGKILEKPQSRKEAFDRIKKLSDNSYSYNTGLYVMDIARGKVISKVVSTEIKVRNIADSEIEKYLDQDPKYNTYGNGYDPLGHYSSTFAESIKGSYNNFLRGIPLEAIIEILKELRVI